MKVFEQLTRCRWAFSIDSDARGRDIKAVILIDNVLDPFSREKTSLYLLNRDIQNLCRPELEKPL
jgi:hypothetical protein